ncbi:GGDEF domain-containing protein [Ciceribacter naphthalenivorans]|uniref:GGDEF domain-containing protein n=1 Tax=Ciceribacter naphthalenivorans TaxID=1118451 RepID=UPI001AEE941A|nr:sensor domain-containing diguanylate cyclase [Ciceribacter naphthalenivorans]
MTEQVSQKLAELHEQSAALVAVYDPDDRLRYANAAFRASYYVEPDETPLWSDLMRRNWQLGRGAIITHPDIDAWLASAIARRGKLQRRAFEADLIDGRWLWVVETILPDGWMLYIATDITELRTEERELRQLRDFATRASQTDELTDISNRRHMWFMLENLLNGAHVSQSRGGCLCLFDLDFFKQINDRFGHQAGDLVLVDFARTVQQTIRLRDGFGRIGGEEFMLIMPDTSIIHAKTIIERVFAAIHKRRPIPDDPEFTYTFSAGLTQIRADDTPQSAYSRADQALYQAKNEGRDCLILAA